MTPDQAQRLQQLLIECSPLIEEYTSAVCPNCVDVCCRQKHGTHRSRDLAYLLALGTPVPPLDAGRDPDGPCQFMGQAGCTLPRWTRAFKCTWFFCEPLLAALNEGDPRKARRLSAALQEMVDRYNGENDEVGEAINQETAIWTRIPEVGASKRNRINADKPKNGSWPHKSQNSHRKNKFLTLKT